MSTTNPFSLDLGNAIPSVVNLPEGLIDPKALEAMAREMFGSLSSQTNIQDLPLQNSGFPITETVHSKPEVHSTQGIGGDYLRTPNDSLRGTGIPSFPSGLNSLAPNLSLPTNGFSFLEELNPDKTDFSNFQVNDPFSFSPSVIPSGTFSNGFFDVASVRRDFRILTEKVNGRNLVWLDNAATTQKPQAVIDRLSYFYQHENSNIHRAAHTLAARSTDAYEAARNKVKAFINAPSAEEIIFVRGTTEGINLIAGTYGMKNIGKDDEIIITWLEHHANIVPWQMLCSLKGAKLKVVPVDEAGQVILSEYERLLGPKTKIVSFTHVSNALGTITPAKQMVEMAHRYGAKVIVDGAQSVSHMPIDVQSLDCDFFVFSGHKVFGPTGIGVVFGKAETLSQMPPWQGGGNMIEDVTFEKTVYQKPPFRFEAGTGNIADAVGLGAAIDYLNKLGMNQIAEYEHSLLEYATKHLQTVPGLKLIGTAKDKASVLSFVLDGHATEEVGKFLSQQGIAVRSGHHCAQPILRRFGLEATVRPSLALYNTCEDVDALINALYSLTGGKKQTYV
jgi:cysteine desulfurase/selenocysteine lyase